MKNVNENKIVISITHLNNRLKDTFDSGYDVGILIALNNKREAHKINCNAPEEIVIDFLISESGLMLIDKDKYNKVKKAGYDIGVMCAIDSI